VTLTRENEQRATADEGVQPHAVQSLGERGRRELDDAIAFIVRWLRKCRDPVSSAMVSVPVAGGPYG